MPRPWPDPRDPPDTPAEARRLRVIAVAIAAVMILAALLPIARALAAPIAAEVPIVPRGQRFVCTPTHVWDGDGPIWCREGPRVRLAGVNARELDGTCRRRARCPRASGRVARDRLAQLLGGARGVGRLGHVLVAGPRLACRSDGWARGTRTAAWCALPDGRDLSGQLLDAGVVAR